MVFVVSFCLCICIYYHLFGSFCRLTWRCFIVRGNFFLFCFVYLNPQISSKTSKTIPIAYQLSYCNCFKELCYFFSCYFLRNLLVFETMIHLIVVFMQFNQLTAELFFIRIFVSFILTYFLTTFNWAASFHVRNVNIIH